MIDLEEFLRTSNLNSEEQAFILGLQNKADKWDKLEAEITAIYEGPEDEGPLCDIGEIAATAFGYL